jgi:hypothetical protein
MASLKDKQLQLPLMWPAEAVGQEGPPTNAPQAVSGESEFDRAWAFLGPSVARGGEHTKSSVLAALGRGTRKLWLTDECAVITEIVNHPSGLRTGNMWLGGGSLEAILALFPAMEAWMVVHGATESRINGRKGWAKVTGYKEFRTVIRKDLRHV